VQQVRDRLRATCDKVGGVAYDANGHHDEHGFGRINAFRAVQ
jgi:thermitase